LFFVVFLHVQEPNTKTKNEVEALKTR